MIRVTCGCKKSWFVDDVNAGQTVACRTCGRSVLVPGGEVTAPAEPPVPRPAPAPAPASAPAGVNTPPTGPIEPYFLTYQDPPPFVGDSKLYRVYRQDGALLFLHLGLYLDGIDYRGAISGAHSADARMLAAGVGLLIAGAQAITAKIEAPKLQARLAVIQAMSPAERLAEADRKPSLLVRAGDLSDVQFVPWDGYRGAWATAHDGELGASLRFRHQGRGKYNLHFRKREDLQLAVAWLQELVGADQVQIKFPTTGG